LATPNIPEAGEVTGLGPGADREALIRQMHGLGPAAVVVTGGHSEELVDLFFDGDRVIEIPGERHPDGAAHGSGCTHSSALAAFLARGADPLQAAFAARKVAAVAVGAGLREIGRGPGPVDVFELTARVEQEADLSR
jgi:hydroxymethylpyrimidine/phosphomethylpyrimidine kinase